AMANGYAISAVTGRADVMEGLGKTHLSSTFFANAPEMAAAIRTIELLRDTNALAQIGILGRRFKYGLRDIVAETELPARVVGMDVSPFLQFNDTPQAAATRVAFYAAVAASGVLLHPNHQWFVSASHSPQDIDTALDACRTAARRAVRGAA
ncbi:MAG: aminotransferase class III-fold pyridoxal phosphate-dependent enzyme, partial [Methylobacterium sp.]|nr:aminotransferase class III-fold pyridoxal phosphate-dependent enzyme [Methylobacterium sp.]